MDELMFIFEKALIKLDSIYVQLDDCSMLVTDKDAVKRIEYAKQKINSASCLLIPIIERGKKL